MRRPIQIAAALVVLALCGSACGSGVALVTGHPCMSDTDCPACANCDTAAGMCVKMSCDISPGDTSGAGGDEGTGGMSIIGTGGAGGVGTGSGGGKGTSGAGGSGTGTGGIAVDGG